MWDARTHSELLRERIRKSGSTTFAHVSGRSMGLTLLPGVRLRVVALGPDEPRVGAVYVFEEGGRLLAHRCVGIDAQGVLFRGDATRRGERVERHAAIVGRVSHLRVAGRWLSVDEPARRALSLGLAGPLLLWRRLPAGLRLRLGAPLARWLFGP